MIVHAPSYARRLLEDLDLADVEISKADTEHPALSMATSGLMTMTGFPDGPVTICPVPLASCAEGALLALRALTCHDILPGIPGYRLLTERAAITTPARSGGHCMLLETKDGVIGLNLARESDWELLPAWLEQEHAGDWAELRAMIVSRDSDTLVERGRLLGLAVADATVIPRGLCNWVTRLNYGERIPPSPGQVPLVLDLSSLWAGPLCSHLWQQAGARVIKVESERRPDGARNGPNEFFQLLNQGKEHLILPLHTSAGQAELRSLLLQADIVLEGSRPRALRQMGIIAEEVLAEKSGLTWVSITGYGRGEPRENWIAYGDDAGIAAGLSAILHEATGEWMICGDAIADPLTALHAALAGWSSWCAGGGSLLDLSLEQTVRHCITATAPPDGDYRARRQHWQDYLDAKGIRPTSPARRDGSLPSEH